MATISTHGKNPCLAIEQSNTRKDKFVDGFFNQIHLDAMNGEMEKVQDLVAAGADVNGRNRYFLSLIHDAAEQGELPAVHLLLEAGADPNATDHEGYFLLHAASEGGHLDIVKALIDGSADVNAIDTDGNPPIQYAAEQGHERIGKLFLSRGIERTLIKCDESRERVESWEKELGGEWFSLMSLLSTSSPRCIGKH